jgi:hypothetical protein
MDRQWDCPFFKHCWDSGMSRLPVAARRWVLAGNKNILLEKMVTISPRTSAGCNTLAVAHRPNTAAVTAYIIDAPLWCTTYLDLDRVVDVEPLPWASCRRGRGR